jgi:hypothetical protein
MLKFLRRSKKYRVIGYARVSIESQIAPKKKVSDKNGK